MTNFFGINITENKRNTDVDGNVFVVGTVAAEQDNEISQFLEKEEEFEKNRNLPLLFEIIKSVCQIVWLINLIAFFKALVSVMSFMQVYNNAPILFWIGFICFIVWLTLFCIERVRKKGQKVHQHLKNTLKRQKLCCIKSNSRLKYLRMQIVLMCLLNDIS